MSFPRFEVHFSSHVFPVVSSQIYSLSKLKEVLCVSEFNQPSFFFIHNSRKYTNGTLLNHYLIHLRHSLFVLNLDKPVRSLHCLHLLYLKQLFTIISFFLLFIHLLIICNMWHSWIGLMKFGSMGGKRGSLHHTQCAQSTMFINVTHSILTSCFLSASTLYSNSSDLLLIDFTIIQLMNELLIVHFPTATCRLPIT